MKIFIKTISGTQHPLEVDENMQLSALKQKIEDDLGYDGTNMKVVFKGKVLSEDSVALGQAGLVENEFLVLVAKKKAVAPKKEEPKAEEPAKPAEPTPAPAPAPAEPKPEEPKPEAPKETPKEDTPAEKPAEEAAAPAPAADPDAPADVGAAASVFATGSQLEGVINDIMEMGFPKDQVVRALRAAYNNPDRAVDYLMNGIPETADLDAPMGAAPAPGAGAGAPAAPAAPATAGAGAGAGAAAGAGGDPTAALAALAAAGGLNPEALAANPQLAAMLQQMLAGQGAQEQQQLSPLAQALQSIPQFDQIRGLIATNPQMLQTIIGQLRTTNPNLFGLINANPQEFVQILEQGIPGTGAPPLSSLGPGLSGGAGAAPGQPRPNEIRITPEEKEAIDRLAALGFPEQVAAEAYLVCGKNEELAANFLFENGAMDFDDGDGGGDGGN